MVPELCEIGRMLLYLKAQMLESVVLQIEFGMLNVNTKLENYGYYIPLLTNAKIDTV